MTTAEWWWSGVVLTLGGLLLTTVAVGWTFLATRTRHRDLLARQGEYERIFQEWMSAQRALPKAIRPEDKERRKALDDSYAPRLDALLPTVGGGRYVDVGRESHWALAQSLSETITSFWRQGLLALAGVWVGTGGAICALLSAPPR